MERFPRTWNWLTRGERGVPKYIWFALAFFFVGNLIQMYVIDSQWRHLYEYREKLHEYRTTTPLPESAIEYFRGIGCDAVFFENPEFHWSGNRNFAQAYDANTGVWVGLSAPSLPARGSWLEEHPESKRVRATLALDYSVAIRAPSIDILENQLVALSCLVRRASEPNGAWQPLTYDFEAIAGTSVEE